MSSTNLYSRSRRRGNTISKDRDHMKVLHLISGGDIGGAKTHVFNLISKLQENIEVKLVCFIKTDFYYDAKKRGINIEVFEQKQRYDFSAIRKLIKEVKQGNYDLVHSHGARANFIAFLIKLFCNVPTVTTIHSDYTLDFKGNFYKDIVYKNLNYLALKSIDYYIGVSNSFKDMLVDRGFSPERIYTVYNGVEVKEKNISVDKEEFLKKYNLSIESDTILVGILARLHPVKGLDVFIKGAKDILNSNKNVAFLIAGDGAEKEKLKKLTVELGIEDKVIFLGFITEKYNFLNTIDINTLTSYSESFPYVILEGALLNKPIVSSNVGGIKDLVSSSKGGLLFEPGEHMDFAKQVLLLIENKRMREEMGQNLSKAVMENYSSDSMCDSHLSIYKKIISRKV